MYKVEGRELERAETKCRMFRCTSQERRVESNGGGEGGLLLRIDNR